MYSMKFDFLEVGTYLSIYNLYFGCKTSELGAKNLRLDARSPKIVFSLFLDRYF